MDQVDVLEAIKQSGMSMVTVDISDRYKNIVLPQLSQSAGARLITTIQEALVKCLRDQCLGNIQNVEGTCVKASWELMTPFEHGMFAVRAISMIRACFSELNQILSEFPRIEHRVVVVSTCLLDIGPNAGTLGLSETQKFSDMLMNIAQASPYGVLVSAATKELVFPKIAMVEVLSPVTRMGVTKECSLFTLEEDAMIANDQPKRPFWKFW